MAHIHFLLIDSNPVFLRIAASYLRSLFPNERYLIETAYSREDAIRKVRRLQPRVILLDLNAPRLSGLTTLAQLRPLAPDAHIIALSLTDAAGYRLAAMHAGAHSFVAKTALSRDLWPVIQRVLRETTPEPAPARAGPGAAPLIRLT